MQGLKRPYGTLQSHSLLSPVALVGWRALGKKGKFGTVQKNRKKKKN